MKDFKISESQGLKNTSVMVDGINYQVINIAPTSLDFIPKKAKELFAYLINGREK